ncbi:MAG: tyrosine--tRNA ligase [Methanobacteriaceae archaeon]|nr:tyrosine--tRNA ligase [Methanobacteriaceae archaeon]
MSTNPIIEKIKKGTIEIISEEELEKKEKIAYVGYEPSGNIHLGHAITIKKLIDLQEAGFKIKILLADLHAYLNGKGTLEEIHEISKYNMECFKALGLSEDTEFILGSERMVNEKYTLDLIELATHTTISRAQRSMAQITRDAKEHYVSETLYPLMQAIDIAHLKADVALGGLEQRKIHMLARELLPKAGYETPVCIHTPLIHGTDGSDKMSSSKNNYIAVTDDSKTIKNKINKSFCPVGQVEDNPIMELAHHYIFDKNDVMLIKRPEKFGGNLELTEDKLHEMYSNEEIHPLDVKNTVANYLIDRFEPVRDYFDKKEN